MTTVIDMGKNVEVVDVRRLMFDGERSERLQEIALLRSIDLGRQAARKIDKEFWDEFTRKLSTKGDEDERLE